MSIPQNIITVAISGNEKIAHSSYLLSFRREFDFIPGQVISIFHGIFKARRIYSIASGNRDAFIRILYKVNPSGLITPQLSYLKKSNTITVSLPYGSFCSLPGKGVCIATGTGIAPFASMYFSGDFEEKILIHGSRTLEEFYFSHEFMKLGDRYIRCCSGENDSQCYPGRVTGYLKQYHKTGNDIIYYLCGKAEMVVDVRDYLIESGVSFTNILAEIYF